MKKVYQTIVDPNIGNCMQAAIASLFELELNDVPNFINSENPYHDMLQMILDKKEYKFSGSLYNYNNKNDINEYTTLNTLSDNDGIDGLFYATVYSPKYTGISKTLDEVRNDFKTGCHAVICYKNCNIVFDPNPDNKNVIKYPFSDELGYNGILNVWLINKK